MPQRNKDMSRLMSNSTSLHVAKPGRRQRRTRRPAAATVEMAFVAPIVFLIILGSIEFGRLNIVRHAVANAAYESARYGIVPGSTAAEISDYAQQHLGILGINGASVTVTPSTILDETEEITVEVVVPMDQNSWIPPRFAAGHQIRSVCNMRTERYFGF